jgi:hypothetical protein
MATPYARAPQPSQSAGPVWVFAPELEPPLLSAVKESREEGKLLMIVNSRKGYVLGERHRQA